MEELEGEHRNFKENALETVHEKKWIYFNDIPVLNFVFWREDSKKEKLRKYLKENDEMLGF